MNEATNFEKARGFVRTNWKSKNFNPNNDPCHYDTSSDEEDEQRAADLAAEQQDVVKENVRSMNSDAIDEHRERDEDDEDYDAEDQEATVVNGTMNRTLVSDSKTRRKFYQNHQPEIVSVSEVTAEGATTVETVADQLATQRAIAEYNKKLPAKRKAKGESLPDIPTSNIVARKRIVKEYKKTGVKTVEAVTYHQVGMTDGGEKTDMNEDKYSMAAKQRALHRATSQQKIERIRTYYGNLIGGFTPTKNPSEIKLLTTEKPEKVPIALQTPSKSFVGGLHNPSATPARALDNPFTPTQYGRQISLSVYNRPKSMANRRPITAKTSEELISRLPGFKPAAAPKGEDGEPLPQLDAQSVREPTLPEFIGGDKWQ